MKDMVVNWRGEEVEDLLGIRFHSKAAFYSSEFYSSSSSTANLHYFACVCVFKVPDSLSTIHIVDCEGCHISFHPLHPGKF